MSADQPLTFDFDVPKRLIAQEPLPNRVDARLMLVERATGRIDHFHIRDLPELVRRGDRLVLNNTRVIPARIQGTRADTGGRWQGLFLEANSDGDWVIVCKTRGRLRVGEAIMLVDRDMRPTVKLWLLQRLEHGQWLAHPESKLSYTDLLLQIGRVP